MDKATALVVAENYTKFKQMFLGLEDGGSLIPCGKPQDYVSSKSREDDVNRIASTVLEIGRAEAEEHGIIRITQPKRRSRDVESVVINFDWPSTT